MSNLKDLRIRIHSVRSTQKITSAMKMVAASKLRRAQMAVEDSRPYVERMTRMLSEFASSLPEGAPVPPLLAGTGNDETHLIVVVTADRGLCGGFNGNVVREVRRRVRDLKGKGKTVKILCLGKKGRDALRGQFRKEIIDTVEGLTRNVVDFETASGIAARIADMFSKEEFDVCTMVYTRFQSAMTQHVTVRQIVPLAAQAADAPEEGGAKTVAEPLGMYILEPSEEEILDILVPRNLAVQLYHALTESYASEQGARMTAMDNATRNAGDMIDALTLTYNRTRQSVITKELIEIISGAEAL
ncbi:MAG: F0F1 ATP synthase subunit gamma [Rhodospirillales bacterium]|jgi:F-type H+-transporting ATPase subunit gamma|nr:F0F1 ATP synthase subunit gamma [Rhodospirillales bacterium]